VPFFPAPPKQILIPFTFPIRFIDFSPHHCPSFNLTASNAPRYPPMFMAPLLPLTIPPPTFATTSFEEKHDD
jgi:hypothetical protein